MGTKQYLLAEPHDLGPNHEIVETFLTELPQFTDHQINVVATVNRSIPLDTLRSCREAARFSLLSVRNASDRMSALSQARNLTIETINRSANPALATISQAAQDFAVATSVTDLLDGDTYRVLTEAMYAGWLASRPDADPSIQPTIIRAAVDLAHQAFLEEPSIETAERLIAAARGFIDRSHGHNVDKELVGILSTATAATALTETVLTEPAKTETAQASA
jgi:DNA-binding phage protein